MPKSKTSKEEIIKNAYKVFLEKGYYHTSITDLSKACSIEKAHFYYYFKDKRDIMFAVLEFIGDWANNHIFIHAYKVNLSSEERMQLILNELGKIHFNRFTGCIYNNTALETANNDDEFIPALQNYFNRWKKALTAIYGEKYDRETSEMKAERFFSELNGTIVLHKVYKDNKYLNTFIDSHLKEI